MTLAVFLALALLAVLFVFSKWRYLGLALGIVTAVGFVATGYGLPARALLAALQNGYDTEAHEWGDHNAIILLGAGSELSDRRTVETGIFGYSRMVKALQVYRACKERSSDCRIIASGGDTHGFGKSEAEIFAADLQELGVAPADLLIEKRSQNTWQNAQFSAPFFAHNRFDRAFLVSSGVHLRRSMLYFNHFGIRAMPIRADYGRPAAAAFPTAYNFFLTDVALHEHIGVWRYYLYNALGWNMKAVKPGAL